MLKRAPQASFKQVDELSDSERGTTVFQAVLPDRGRQQLNSEVNDTSHDRVGANRISDEGGAHLG